LGDAIGLLDILTVCIDDVECLFLFQVRLGVQRLGNVSIL
jgi:hypothetical protein